MWWAVVTTTTVGYGDYTPVTQVGRAIATVVMIVGIGLIGTVSATVAAWFVDAAERRWHRGADGTSADVEAAAGPPAESQAALLVRLDELAAQQAEIRALLVAMQRPTTSG